jgi:hypothetical protein
MSPASLSIAPSLVQACAVGNACRTDRSIPLRILLALLIAALFLALAAAVTRPDRADFEAFAAARLQDQIIRMDIEDESNPVGAAAVALCKLKPSDCSEVILAAIDIRFRKGPFSVTAEADWNDRGFSCLGAFGRFWCRATRS